MTTPFDDIVSREAARVSFGNEADDYAERHAIIAVELEDGFGDQRTDAEIDAKAHELCGHTFGGEFTILVANQQVSKTYRRSGDEWHGTAYPNVYLWRVRPRFAHDLDELAAELERVASYGKACVIRGRPLRDFGNEPQRRLANPCSDSPTFGSVEDGLRWMCIDVDGVPTDVDPATNPDAYADVARQVLPSELAGGRCFYQLSASAGVKSGARVHLWFWLEHRAHDDALRAWADETEHVDASLFGAVQPHYVAPPTFIAPADGWGETTLDDILPRRTGWLHGTETVWPRGLMGITKWRAHQERLELDAIVRQKARSEQSQRMWNDWRASPQGLQKRGEKAVAASVRGILEAREGDRNTTICRKANFLGRVIAEGALDIGTARAELAAAAQHALGAEWSRRRSTTLEAIERCLASGMAAHG